MIFVASGTMLPMDTHLQLAWVACASCHQEHDCSCGKHAAAFQKHSTVSAWGLHHALGDIWCREPMHSGTSPIVQVSDDKISKLCFDQRSLAFTLKHLSSGLWFPSQNAIKLAASAGSSRLARCAIKLMEWSPSSGSTTMFWHTLLM